MGITVDNVTKRFGDFVALHDVSIEVPDGSLTALLGPSGSGKSTLLRVIAGLERPETGRVLLNGKDVTPQKVQDRGVGFVFQHYAAFKHMSVRDNLLMGAFTVPQSERPQRLERVFGIFPVLNERKKQIAGTLSGGEQQMVAIGRGLMGGPKLLMLDEPSLGLAPILVEEVFRVITEINRLGVTVLLVEQNTQNALGLAHKGFVMELGRIALSGSGGELLANSNVRRAYLGL